jgi:hypothetical protein
VNFLQFIFLVLLWGIPTVLLISTYRQQTKKQQLDIINDIKQPHFIFGLGLMTFAVLLLFSSSITQMEWLRTVGVVLITIGGLNVLVVGFIKKEVDTRKGIIFGLWLLAFVIAFIYIFY